MIINHRYNSFKIIKKGSINKHHPYILKIVKRIKMQNFQLYELYKLSTNDTIPVYVFLPIHWQGLRYGNLYVLIIQ